MSQARLAALIAAKTEVNDLAFRTPYDNLDRVVETPLICPEPTLARQSEADSCDLNTIMKRYGSVEQFKIANPPPEGFYADITNVGTFEDAMNLIALGDSIFNQLPAETRARFKNDTAVMLDFLADSSNDDEAIRLGLKPKPDMPAAPPAPTPAAPPAPSTGSGTPPPA